MGEIQGSKEDDLKIGNWGAQLVLPGTMCDLNHIRLPICQRLRKRIIQC
jgi:hypothetical protein